MIRKEIAERLDEIDLDLWAIDARYDGPFPPDAVARKEQLLKERRELLQRQKELT